MSHRDTDQPRVDRDLLDQLVRENGLTPDYINDAERQDREAAREWLNESVFDWMLPEHEIQLAHEGSGGGGHWDGSMPVRIHTFDGECNGYRSGNYLHYTIAAIAQALQACYGLEASVDFQTSITKQDFAGDNVSEGGGDHDDKKRVGACSSPAAAHVPFPFQQKRRESQREAARRSRKKKKEEVAHMQDRLRITTRA